ncbi:NADPH oxidase family protein [Pontibacterium sp.]|uniref:NADPH oxidase family protein n=1 Tax=Pontibacterium sp. TaxID=2036026 RepID=UPI003510D2D9
MSDSFSTQSSYGSSWLASMSSWLAGRRLWFKNLPWLTLMLGLAGYQFWIGYTYESNDTTNIYLRLSRASSYVLLLVLVVLWLPVMRNGLSVLRRSWVGEWLPIENANALHKWLGHICIVFTLVHGTQYLLYLNTLSEPFTKVLFAEESDLVRSMRTTMYEFVSEDESIDVVGQWIENGRTQEGYEEQVKPIMEEDCTKCHSRTSTQTYAIQWMPLTKYDDVVSLSDEGWLSRQFRINVSGLVMFVLFFVVWYTSLERFRKRHHHHFQQLHLLGYLLAILGLLHIPSLEWIVAPTVVLFVEFYLSKRSRTYRRQPSRLTAITDDLLRLEIKRPERLKIRAGHYVDLRIPGLFSDRTESEKQCTTVLCREWHPFSLTGSRNDPDKLVLKVRAQGDWTYALRDTLGNSDACELDIDVRGPYASPITHATRRKDWFMVAGGIGITPFLSLLRELKKQPTEPYHLHLVWVLREPALMKWIRPLLEKLCEHNNVQCHWHFYFTGDQRLSLEEQEKLKAIGSLHLHRVRPDWQALVTEIAATGIRPTCYVCGPDAMSRQVKKACRKQGWAVHKEEF